MKKLLLFTLAAVMLVTLAACAGNTPANTSENSAQSSARTSADEKTESSEARETASSAVSETSEAEAGSSAAPGSEPDDTPDSQEPQSSEPVSEPVSEHKSVLVVVFSATGTTKGVAEKIAAIENADVYEIKAAQEYTSADLNWNDRNSRSTKEQNDKSARPGIGSERVSLEGYEKIYIGYPIWWGEEPRIMDTFVESYDFGGITVIPFCTSSSSGMGRSGKNLAENAKSGTWLEGRRFSGGVSESELRDWIEGLK